MDGLDGGRGQLTTASNGVEMTRLVLRVIASIKSELKLHRSWQTIEFKIQPDSITK